MIFSSPDGIERLLVENGVERDRGLAGLAIADDQFALAAADRDQGVDRLQSGRHRLVHRFARDDAGRFDVDARLVVGLDRPLAVDRIAERVDDAAEQALADRHLDDGARALDGLAFLDLAVGAEDHDADIVAFEVERHAAHAALELDHLAGLHIVETVDAGDAVADRQHLADFRNLGLLAEILDLLLEDGGDFRGADIHYRASFIACLIELSLVRSEVSTMRLPSLTTSPPMMAGSILMSRSTSLPLTALSAAAQRRDVFVLELFGDRDLGRRLALVLGDELAVPADHVAHREQPAVRRHELEEPRREAADPGADRAPHASACNCSSAENTGLRTSRVRSALSATSASKRSRSAFTASIAFASLRKIEQRGRVTAGHAGHEGFFACHVACSSSAVLLEFSARPATGANGRRKPLGFKRDSGHRGGCGMLREPAKIAGLLT